MADDPLAHLLPDMPFTVNVRVPLRAGDPNVRIAFGGTWCRFRLKVYKDGACRWAYEVHDACRQPGRTIVQAGVRLYWGQALDAGLLARIKIEQGHGWDP
jgi:hypothetical protein